MAGPRVARCLVVYCAAFAAAAIASRADGVVYEKIPLGAIFEQGSDEVQTAFKLAVFKHNQNNTERRFELQAYVDVIKTADAFKLSKLNFDNDDDFGEPTKTNAAAAASEPTESRRFSRKRPRPTRSAMAVVNSSKQKEPVAIAAAAAGNSSSSPPPPPNRGRGRWPVTVTRVQDQTTDGGSLTVPCRSFTPRTVVRRRTPPTTTTTSTTEATAAADDRLSHAPSVATATRPHGVTLSTCWRLVDTAADPATKWFLKMTTTERWVRPTNDRSQPPLAERRRRFPTFPVTFFSQ